MAESICQDRGVERDFPEVVTLGETMLRVTPADGGRLESARLWRAEVGGSESNVAVGLARLGVAAGWISKVPDSALGRRVVETIRGLGVDTSRVRVSPGTRQAIYFLDPGAGVRPSTVIYDRERSAASQMEPDDVDWEYVGKAKLVHLTGITPALGHGPLRVVQKAVEICRERGIYVSFDINYRRHLWTVEEAHRVLEPLLGSVDVLILSQRDAPVALPGWKGGTPESLLESLEDRYHTRVAVVSCGADGALALERGGEPLRYPALRTAEVDRIGRGDAFAAGFLYGWLRGGVKEALAYGTAMAALKMTIPGDMPLVAREEVEALISGNASVGDVIR